MRGHGGHPVDLGLQGQARGPGTGQKELLLEWTSWAVSSHWRCESIISINRSSSGLYSAGLGGMGPSKPSTQGEPIDIIASFQKWIFDAA